MNHFSNAPPDPAVVACRLKPMTVEALPFVAQGKALQLVQQWLSNVPPAVARDRLNLAQSLAMDLALVLPSMLGSTAFDRCAKSLKGRAPADIAAVALLRRGQHRLARLTPTTFEDLATGDKRPLLRSPDFDVGPEEAAFGRFAFTQDGAAIAVGPIFGLDRAAFNIAQGFIRSDGRGLTNPIRCAEAVFRHMARHGVAPREPALPFDPANDPIDALAAAWAALNGEPGPGERDRVRAFIGIDPLLNALISVSIAEDAGEKRLAAAYRRIAGEIIAFMAARETYGSARFSLDRAAAALEAAIAQDRCGPDTRALFNELRTQARARSAAQSSTTPSDLDKLIQRIRGLREKTVKQGCTEQEAMAAAEKVAELLDRYGLSLSELDLRKQKCEGIGVETGRKRRSPIDDCIGTVAAFFECKVWAETNHDGTIRYIFFGMPGDVQASAYLYDLIVQAFASETATFRRGEFYGSLDSGPRRSATNSFHIGLAHGIIDKLQALRAARDAARDQSGGRALVPVKRSIVDEELERLGLSLRSVQAPRRTVIRDAYGAGKEAGEKFEYRAGIEAG